jgi:hypothetical protein
MSKLQLKLVSKTARKIAIVLAVAALAIGAYYVYYRFFQPITMINYKGTVLAFRTDLREAAKVPVYPGEEELYRDTMHQLVQNVTIVYKDAGANGTPYYVVEAFEIANKMNIAYMLTFGTVDPNTGEMIPSTPPGFNSMAVSSYENLPGKIQNPIIAIVHPKFANETSVRNDGHVTFISGTDLHQLDLATVKFLMVELGITESDLSA